MLRRTFFFSDRALLLAWLGVFAGLSIRLFEASQLALNPDEAWHTLFALEPTWAQTWAEAIADYHPPLLALLERPLAGLLLNEIGPRLIPALAGALAPLFAFAWLRRRAGLVEAIVAFTLLEFAPRMVSLSAQNRVYSLALLLTAATLYCLDRAIDEDGRVPLFGAAGLLAALAAWTAFPFALLLPAIVIYGAWRIRSIEDNRKLWRGLAVYCALVAVAYGALYFAQVRHLLARHGAEDVSWLAHAFPQGDLLFPVRAFLAQFLYLGGGESSHSTRYALLPALLFAVSTLWNRAWRPLAVLPFLAATITAYLGIFPYAATRHTNLLGFPIVLMLSLLAGRIVKRPAVAAICVIPAAVVWLALAPRDRLDFPRSMLVPAEHSAAARYVLATVPKMQPMIVSAEAYHWLRYAMRKEPGLAPVLARQDPWRFPSGEFLLERARALRAVHGLDPAQPLWVAEGFEASIGERLKWPTGPRRGGFYVYPLPPGY